MKKLTFKYLLTKKEIIYNTIIYPVESNYGIHAKVRFIVLWEVVYFTQYK